MGVSTDRTHDSHGYCQPHAYKYRTYGDPLYEHPPKPVVICKEDGCDSPVDSHGWCGKHAARWRRHGDPLRPNVYKTAEQKTFGYLDDGSAWIELTKGYRAIVDADDLDELRQYSWYANVKKNGVYAERTVKANGQRANIQMHRQILGLTDGAVHTDHLNHDHLDNRRANLRPCSQAKNNRNQPLTKVNTSGFKGVSWDKRRSVWRAAIGVNGKQTHLGYFDDPIAAARSYDEAAPKFHGEFALRNVDLGLLPEAA